MNPVRRRKKRPNYGVRTVELSRGKNGFGFTISGQQPCILSCIVPGSPAENAGLRAGDYLVAVEGQSVSKVPHDDVVRLIGVSAGILKLQIAENYYSDSSDDDVIVTARQKPKYPHKPRNNAQNTRSTANQQSRAAKVVRDLRTGAMFEEQVVPVEQKIPLSPLRSIKLLPVPDLSLHQWKPPSYLSAPLSRIILPGTSSDINQRESIEEQPIYQAIVGYLGTIEMPRKLPPGSRLQIVRGCIKRLRAEKRSHTAVLMSVFNQRLKLTNNSGQTLAVYPADRVTFCGATSEEDRRHFGIVTTSADEDPSNSCHVFAVDPRPHVEHSQRAQTFKLECTIDPATGQCREFPQSCDPIINPIRVFYENGIRQNEMEEPVMANSPQPSNDSTTTTSNSDSGIGFRDDCGNQSDRILVVDVQNQRLHIQQIDQMDQPGRVSTVECTQRLTVRAMPDPVVPNGNRSQSPLSVGSDSPGVANENMSVSSEASKSPDVTLIPFDGKNNTVLSSDKINNSIVFNSFDVNGHHSTDDMSLGSARSQDALLMSYKLSPKVFNVPQMQTPPMSHSLEDLKVTEQSRQHNAASLSRSHWGSLQELRSFVSDCFENSTATQHSHEDPDQGVSSWATSFEKLLEDPDGLQTFAEFLKKEFSHENIYFWVACERYRWLEGVEARRQAAQQIFERHLAPGAPEPVNVDSQARQVSPAQLHLAQPTLFLQAQKQIFNLMKFDSFPRFLKSELYKECVLREVAGEALPLRGRLDSALQLHQDHPQRQALAKVQKSRSDVEEKSRKSLLPWTRPNKVTSSDTESINSSRSSLASWDPSGLGPALCRLVLPDGATAVVAIRPPQTVGQLVARLLDKRSLRYSTFQVFIGHSTKAVSLEDDADMLGGQEARVVHRVVFRLDLPSRKTLTVKAKHGKTLAQVLRPILNKYGYRLEMVTLCLMSENEVVEPTAAVTTVDGQRLQVLTRSTPTECAHLGWRVGDCPKKTAPSLDEITNRVFEELLQGKADNLPQASDQASVRSDDWGSEHSSGILGRFLRRDSAFLDKHKEGRHKNKKVAKYSSEETVRTKPCKLPVPPLIAKWKPLAKADGRSESDVLYEGLKRAQRSRLEDQRGTEINFELPDFLKDKENAPQNGKKVRKVRLDETAEATGNSTFYQTANLSQASSQESLRLTDQSFSGDGIIPTSEAAEEYFLGARGQTPPPLPPKPKHLPPTSRPCRIRRAVYLDQPSSSFV